ncbi:isoamyl acetate-hydrolyzing esterase [Coemansia sp. RSA 1199]|nr:isoamyl acetate-hydrolyzing esterase [Coemansia sp. RSA 1199]
MDVLNRGFSGYNTRDALRVASHVFPRSTGMSQKGPERSFAFPETPKAPRLCLLFFGANDARLAPYAQHVPLDEFYENLHTLVMLLRDPNSDYYSPDTRIMFITPPAIGDRMVEDVARRNGYEPDRKNAVTKLYADAVKKVAKEHDLPVVDIWTAIEDLVRGSTSVDSPDCKTENNVAGFVESNTAEHDVPTEGASTSPFEGYEKYLLDGLHLNRSGNELLFRLIVSEIEKTWTSENTA